MEREYGDTKQRWYIKKERGDGMKIVRKKMWRKNETDKDGRWKKKEKEKEKVKKEREEEEEREKERQRESEWESDGGRQRKEWDR